MYDNLVLMTDSYKVTHAKQYPPGTTMVYSYLEARSGGKFPATVFFGLQYFIKRYLTGAVVNYEKIDEAATLYSAHFGNAGLFNRAGWEHIVRDHLGCLPVSIKAVPEGTLVGEGNVLVTVENTCPECYWLTNYLETLLVQVWYPTTVSTLSYEMRKLIGEYLVATQGDEAGLEFKLHDFGCRGVSSMESAGIGGAAHLVNFLGTDTVPALRVAREYYGAEMAGYSIPAAEHSTITSWGGPEHEVDAFRNMLNQYPTGLVAVVSDSYNIERACVEYWGEELLEQVMTRDGTLVVRPDSGDPTVVVPKVLELLGGSFGFTYTKTWHKMLNSKVRVIQGDGINYESTREILEAVASSGWSTGNLAFGMGGALLQQLNRDTQRFAFKCSYVEVDGVGRDVYKQPKTDPSKNSKRGRMMLVDVNGVPTTMRQESSEINMLVEVFRDGRLLYDQDFDEIRKRARCYTSQLLLPRVT